VIAGIEVGHAHGAERDAGCREIVWIGALAVAFEMGARQHHRGRISDRGLLLGQGRRLDRAVELPFVIERSGPSQIGALRRCRACHERKGRAEG